MKKKDLQEIKNMSEEQLLADVIKLKKEIVEAKMDQHLNKLKDVKSIERKRKNIAQILTIISQKQLIKKFEEENKKGAE